MEYFEKDKTYTFDEIKEIYKNASAVALERFMKDIDNADVKDPMFTLMLSMTAMELMSSMHAIMFCERVNKEDKEN